jgi:hypothetical protein
MQGARLPAPEVLTATVLPDSHWQLPVNREVPPHSGVSFSASNRNANVGRPTAHFVGMTSRAPGGVSAVDPQSHSSAFSS